MARGSRKLGKKTDARSLGRRAASKDGKLILVVCEGGKTEPKYFKGLRTKWKLSKFSVEILGRECGSAPISVVNEAVRLDKDNNEIRYDEIWCVFDREGVRNKPASYDEAVDKAKANKLKLAISAPCFELWYLLHYKYTTRSFDTCRDIVKELKKHIPKYSKSEDYTDELENRLAEALRNAKHLRKDNERTDRDRPSTDVDKLVNSIRKLKRS